MKTYELPELTAGEKALPVSRYYLNYPLHYPNPLYSQLLSQGAMDPKDAIALEDWQKLLTVDDYMMRSTGTACCPTDQATLPITPCSRAILLRRCACGTCAG